MSAFTLALAQYPIEQLPSLDAWRGKIGRWVSDAVEAGAQLLVFPEYAAMELASIDPASMGDLDATLRFVASMADEIDGFHAWLAQDNDVHIVAGSLPLPLPDGRIVNRARLFAPNGKHGFQDKRVMTRWERDSWRIDPGEAVKLFETTLGPIGIAICYDSEFPLIARAQIEAGAQLILVPSCTDTVQGYWRVRIGAQARALEGQCFVAQSPTVGMADWSPVLDANHGAAGLYGPPDGDVPDDGVLALGPLDEPGWIYADVDLDRVTQWRTEGAVRPMTHWPEQVPAGPPAGLACEIVDLR